MMIASQTLLLDFLSIITRVGVIPNHQKYAADENCGKIKILALFPSHCVLRLRPRDAPGNLIRRVLRKNTKNSTNFDLIY